MAKLRKDFEEILIKSVHDDELVPAKQNTDAMCDEWDSFIALLDNERTEKFYDWQSDLRIPEFPSHVLTQSSIDANRDFSTRDFVECYLEEGTEQALKAADAAKELINRTLNQRHLYYYQKRVRGKMLAQLLGETYFECWWEQELKPTVVGQKPIEDDVFDEESGEIIQSAGDMEDVEADIPIVDRFNYDVIDRRKVHTDSRYVYSLQEKDFVWFERDKTLDELIRDQERCGYFNLDKVKKAFKGDVTTDVQEDLQYKDGDETRIYSKSGRWVTTYKRYGKFWCLPKERDEETGLPTEADFGLDKDGFPKPKAELHEMIIELVKVPGASSPITIAFHPTPYVDAYGKPFRPIGRGKCYIHPTKDAGFGDAKFAHDLQIGIDDSFNLGRDKAMLSTLPLFQVREASYADNDTLYIEPSHFIKVQEVGDITEFKIQDNSQSMINQIAMLTNSMQQFDAIQPVTMGRLPGAASTTATAVAGAEQNAGVRSSFKSMTWEYTADMEFYWFIMHMTGVFAKPETGIQLLGDKVYDFDPRRDYWFKPVSSAVESEQSKQVKTKNLTQVLQILTPYAQMYAGQPQFTSIINHLIKRILTYVGDEVSQVTGKLLDPSVPAMQPGMEGGPEGMMPGGVQQSKALPSPETSNQAGMPMSPTEMLARRGGMSAY